MSGRREVRERLRSLGEIGEILGSMKTLALMETHRLARLAANQQQVVDGIERAAARVCGAWPGLLERPPAALELCLLIGSERGFCGDYNDALRTALADRERRRSRPRQRLVVGNRLAFRLAGEVRVDGAGGADEVPAVLARTVDTVLELQQRQGSLDLVVLHHRSGSPGVVETLLLPPFTGLAVVPQISPPIVHLSPGRLLAELADHYLFASLHALFYSSLLAENQRRVQHLEAAGRRLEEELGGLRRRANTLRQEEITEEIEVILLGAQET